MNRHAIPVAAASVAMLVAGCGSDDGDKGAATAATTANAASQAAALPPGLAGGYTRYVSKADIERTQKTRSEAGPHQERPKPAKALLFFDPKAMTVRNEAADFVVQHDYSASADGKLVIRGYQHPEVGAFCGPEIAQNAAYTWKLSGDKLTIAVVNDPCADRDSTLTGVWTRR